MKRFLRITQEAVLGTYNSGGSAIWIRLDTPKAFVPMATPEFWSIMSGSGFAVPALFGSQTTGLGATLTTPLSFSQFLFLAGWAGIRINTGQTSPWSTSEVAGDLASCTVDFGYSNFDGTLRRKRQLGVKVAQWGFGGSKASPVLNGSFSLLGCTPQGNSFDSSTDPSSGVFPEPADSQFPTDTMLFQHLRGGFTIGTSRTNFESFSFSSSNKLRAYFDESRFANAIRLGGRTSTASTSLRLKATPDDRAAFEQAAAKSLSLAFTNGTNTATINLNGNNQITGHDENNPLDEEIYYDLSLTNYLDTAAPGDLSISYA